MAVNPPESSLTSSEGIIVKSVNEDVVQGIKIKTKQVSLSADPFSKPQQNFDIKQTFRTQDF